jgi:predicted nucleic acid-binding protein
VIFVDTSVWVSFLCDANAPVQSRLVALLDDDEVALAAPVRFELLAGASQHDRARLRRILSALPLFFPSRDTWRLLDTWLDRAGRAGHRFAVGDALIAAIAAERGGSIWSLDSDFARMGALGLVKLLKTR